MPIVTTSPFFTPPPAEWDTWDGSVSVVTAWPGSNATFITGQMKDASSFLVNAHQSGANYLMLGSFNGTAFTAGTIDTSGNIAPILFGVDQLDTDKFIFVKQTTATAGRVVTTSGTTTITRQTLNGGLEPTLATIANGGNRACKSVAMVNTGRAVTPYVSGTNLLHMTGFDISGNTVTAGIASAALSGTTSTNWRKPNVFNMGTDGYVVIYYRGEGQDIQANAGSYDGGTHSVGTRQTVYNGSSALVQNYRAHKLDDQHIAVLYRTSATDMEMVMIKKTGLVMTQGTPVSVISGGGGSISENSIGFTDTTENTLSVITNNPTTAYLYEMNYPGLTFNLINSTSISEGSISGATGTIVPYGANQGIILYMDTAGVPTMAAITP